MAESASVPLTNDQASQFVNQLSHEARAILYRHLWDKSIDTSMLEELGIEQLNIGQLESGQKPQVICPHVGCEAMFQVNALRRVSYHQRKETPYDIEWGDPDQNYKDTEVCYPHGSEDDGHAWYDHAFFCPECGVPVALPAGWSVSS